MFEGYNKSKNYLKNKMFLGIVEDTKDPNRLGRIKVRVQGVFNDIDLEHIPWAVPWKSRGGKDFDKPSVGKAVNVIFPQGLLYSPEYIFSEKYNINLENKLQNISDDEYDNFTALLFDDKNQIYTDGENLMIDFLYNQISLRKESINLHLKDNSQILNLGNNDSSQSAILGDHFLTWFDEFINTLVQPTSLVGNISAPILKPQLDQVMLKYIALKKTFLSEHVKIVDNASCLSFGDDRESTPTADDIIAINEEKLLNSPEVDTEVKNEITENREEDNKIISENKPDTEDIITEDIDVEPSGDSGIEENINQNVDISNVDLNEDEELNLQKTVNVENKNSTKTEVIVEEPPADPYANFWAGRVGKSAPSEKIKTKPNYGSYTTYEYSSSSTSTSPTSYSSYSDIKTNQKTRLLRNGDTLKNGELESKDLKSVKINGAYYQLEEHAADALVKMNREFKKHFNVEIPMNNTYRTFQKQKELKKYYTSQGNPGRAATPGTSKHGWGIAMDINTGGLKFKSKHVQWIMKNGGQFNWIKPAWAKSGGSNPEAWHFEYNGSDTIYG